MCKRERERKRDRGRKREGWERERGRREGGEGRCKMHCLFMSRLIHPSLIHSPPSFTITLSLSLLPSTFSNMLVISLPTTATTTTLTTIYV